MPAQEEIADRLMKVLVTFAVDAEFAPWRRLRKFRRATLQPHPMYEAQIGENAVRVVLTGMGWENARRAVQTVLEDLPDVCISSGLAGGLRPGYRPGEILAARHVGEVKGGRVMRSDAELLEAAASCGAQIVDMFLSSRWLVVSADEKRRIGQFGDAVDMESFRVFAAASGRGVPSVAIRAVADPVELDLPLDFSQVINERGQIRSARLLALVAARPSRLSGLIRLGRTSWRAAASLAQLLDRYVAALVDRAAHREGYVLEEVTAT